MKLQLLLLTLLCLVSHVSSQSTFFISTSQPFCVQIDSPPLTLIRAKYEVTPPTTSSSSSLGEPDQAMGKVFARYDPSPPQATGNKADPISMAKKASSKKGEENVKQQEITSSTLKNSMAFKIPAENRGVHNFCIQILAASQSKPHQVSLSIQQGNADSSYYTDKESNALKSTFSNLKTQTVMLIDEMEMVLSEADYVKGKEIEFQASSLGVHEASGWWPIIQVFVMVVVGAYQVWNLEGFFKRKKLV
jgi:hypothetical protein